MTPVRPAGHLPVLETTDKDRVVSSLLAVLFCLLASVVALGVVWFSNLASTPAPSVPFFPGIELMGGSPSMVAQSLDVSPPEETRDDPSAQASPSVAAELFAMIEQLGELERSEVQEPGSATGVGTGDRPGTGSSIVPPIEVNPERWFFQIDCRDDVEIYADMLEQLGIQLGAFDSTSFCYLSKLTEVRPTVRRVNTGKDARFFTLWQQGTLASLEHELFRRAGISSIEGDVIHFFDPQTEARLAHLEREAAKSKGRRTGDIRRTYFAIAKQPQGSFEFIVVRQRFFN